MDAVLWTPDPGREDLVPFPLLGRPLYAPVTPEETRRYPHLIPLGRVELPPLGPLPFHLAEVDLPRE